MYLYYFNVLLCCGLSIVIKVLFDVILPKTASIEITKFSTSIIR